MPEVFRQGGLRYFFYSNEALPGRTLGVPLARFPRLFRATPVVCAKVEISRTRGDPRVHRFYEACGFKPNLRTAYAATRPTDAR